MWDMRHSRAQFKDGDSKLKKTVSILLVLLLAATLIIVPAGGLELGGNQQTVETGDEDASSALDARESEEADGLDENGAALLAAEESPVSPEGAVEGDSNMLLAMNDLTALADSGSISGFLWVDGNGMAPTDWNGLFDAGEWALGNFAVYLYDADALAGPVTNHTTPIAQTTTSVNGTYVFEGLAAGNYIVGLVSGFVDGVEFLLPFNFTNQNKFEINWDAIDWDTWDDDRDQLMALTEVITLGENESAVNIDAAMRLPMGIQATGILEDLWNSAVGTNHRIDDTDWRVVRKQTISGGNYVMLLRLNSISTGNHFNTENSSEYDGSLLQGRITSHYAGTSYPTIKAIAVQPNLGSHTDVNFLTQPTNTPAGTQTRDIMFALSYRDIKTLIPGGEGIRAPLPTVYRQGVNAFERYYLRTSVNASTLWGVSFISDSLDGGISPFSTRISDIAAIWVGTSLTRQVTVHYVDASGTTLRPPDTRTVTFGNDFTVQNSDIPTIANYNFSDRWRTTPTGALLNPPIRLTNVTTNSNIYLVYNEIPKERYWVYKDTNLNNLLSTWHWLADAVNACGTDGGYTIYATENDTDMSDTPGTDPKGPINPLYKNLAVTIPSNKTITLTSHSSAVTPFVITQRSVNARHLSVFGSLTMRNIVLDGITTGGGLQVGDRQFGLTGSFVMDNGAVVRNCNSTGNGGGVFISQGSMIMNSGRIIDNRSGGVMGGGGVCINAGTFTMNNGEISGNRANSQGGGIYVATQDGSTTDFFRMNGGSIINNTASNTGGGVQVAPYATFEMTAGLIDNNTATLTGGGVALSYARFTMSGGTISNNTTSSFGGGGIWVDSNSTLIVTAGQIRSNKAPSGGGGGIFTSNYGNIRIAPGVIFSGNTASSAVDIGMNATEYVAVFQTDLSPNGIYSPWAPGGYSNCISFVAAHPVNNYDINVITFPVTVRYVDLNGASIPGRPETTTQVHYGRTFSQNPITPIPGYKTEGYFVGTTFNPPTHVYTPATSYTSPIIKGNHTVYFVYREITYTTLTVSKEVAGNYGERLKLWTFTAYFEDEDGTPFTAPYPFTITHRDGTTSVGTKTPNATDGSISFDLKHGDVISLGEVRRDATIRIVETPDSEYAASFIDSLSPATKVNGNDTGKVPMSENRRFDFTNAYDDTPESGITAGGASALALSALILVATGAIVVYVVRRRRQVF